MYINNYFNTTIWNEQKPEFVKSLTKASNKYIKDAKNNPEAVKKFIIAVGAGWKDAINDPKAATAALVKRNPAADSSLEQRRLELAIKANVLSDYVKANGMGGIDKDRFAAALQQLAETYEYKNKPDAKLYYTDAFLPAGGVSLN